MVISFVWVGQFQGLFELWMADLIAGAQPLVFGTWTNPGNPVGLVVVPTFEGAPEACSCYQICKACELSHGPPALLALWSHAGSIIPWLPQLHRNTEFFGRSFASDKQKWFALHIGVLEGIWRCHHKTYRHLILPRARFQKGNLSHAAWIAFWWCWSTNVEYANVKLKGTKTRWASLPCHTKV